MISTPSAAANTQPLETSSVSAWVKRHPLFVYFVIAFGGTWLIFLPILLSERGLGLFSIPDAAVFILFILATYAGPFLSAFVVTGITEGRSGERGLLRRMVQWRVGFQWYLLVLIGYPLVFLIPAVATLGTQALNVGPQNLFPLLTGYLLAIPVGFILPTLGEETGWRGFALPRLERAYGPLVGTCILGILHALWHLPAYFVNGLISTGGFNPTIFVSNSLAIVAFTFIWTWLFNNAKGSILFATFMHATSNANSSLLPKMLNTGTQDPWFGFKVAAVVALVLIALTRSRLSYERLQKEEKSHVN